MRERLRQLRGVDRVHSFLLAASVALLFVVVAALLPVDSDTTNISWSPTRTVGHGSDGFVHREVLLARHRPEEMNATFDWSCEFIRSRESGQLLFATSEGRVSDLWVGIRAGNGGVEVVQGDGEVLAFATARASSCETSLHLLDRTLTARFGAETAVAELPSFDPLVSPFVSSLKVSRDVVDAGVAVSVELETFSSGTTPSPIGLTLSVLALLIVIAVLVRAFRQRSRARSDRRGAKAPTVMVVGGLLLWLPVAPFFLDDGWVRVSALNLKNFANVYNLYQSWDTRIPVGWIQYLWYSPWLSVTDALVWQRAWSFLAICVGWFVIRRIAITHFSIDRLSEYVLMIVYLSMSAAWLLTLRPEPFVSLVSAVALFLALSALHSGRFSNCLLSIGVGAVGASLHTSGGVAIVPGLAALAWWGWSNWSDRPRLRVVLPVFGALCVAATVVVLSTLTNRNLADWASNGAVFESAIGASGWRDELGRYTALFGGEGDTVLRRGTFFLIGFALLGFLLTRKRLGTPERFLGACLIGSLLMLLITPTKWPWHFGSLVWIVVISVTVLFDRARREALARNQGARFAWRVFLMVAVASIIIWVSPDDWGPLSRIQARHSIETSIADVFAEPLAWIGVAALLFVLLLRLGSRFEVGHLRSSLALAMIPFVVTVGAFWRDSFRSAGWTIGRQSLSPISKSYSCGLADEIHLPDVRRPTVAHAISPDPAVDEKDALKRLGLDLSRHTLSTAAPSLGQEFEVVEGTQYLLVFARGIAYGEDVLDITLDSSAGPRTMEIPGEVSVVPDRFTPILAQMPPGTVGGPGETVVEIRSSTSADDIEVSDPIALPSAALSTLNRPDGEFVQIDPFYRMAFPCVRERFFDHGIVEVPTFTLGVFPILLMSPLYVALDTRDHVEGTTTGAFAFDFTWILRPDR